VLDAKIRIIMKYNCAPKRPCFVSRPMFGHGLSQLRATARVGGHGIRQLRVTAHVESLCASCMSRTGRVWVASSFVRIPEITFGLF
jgi:hypothetical protein